MRVSTVVATLMAIFLATSVAAQQQTGEIFGRAEDASGGVLPGTTVTVAGPGLIQPRVVVTSDTGTYRVPELPIGTYSVTFELPGFRSVQHTDVRITIGFSAQVNGRLEVSSIQETVTVSGESPLIDTKSTGTRTSFDLESLQNLPSARDPWVMLERSPSIAMDRVNVGGSQSGQQSNYVARGASTGNNKWSIDGVDITDMSATGASPIYYDFDMLEEMQVTTGGADVTQQTGGVGINLVTKGGTDSFRGTGRLFITDDAFQADNVDDEVRAAGAGSGAPIQNIQDYGFEVGGPIMRGKLWYWGSYGRQDIKVGVVGFYKDTSTCRPTPPTDTQGLRDCLETDLTTLNNYNVKLTYTPFTNNRLGFQNTWAEKVRNARDASNTRPIETTYRQKAVSSDFGTFGWITGPSPFWKLSDQHVFSDKLLMDVQWAHLGNNFVLDFHEDSLSDVQVRLETTTGVYGRSYTQSVFMRPTNSLDATANYFQPNTLGGDHAFKFGLRWRNAHSTSLSHWGGNAIARYTNGVSNSVDVYRDGNAITHLNTWAFFAQDTYTVKRSTITLGLRVDRQTDTGEASTVAASPLAPVHLPAIDFPGVDPGVTWTNFSPRLGFNYDISGQGRTVAKASYAMYFGQLAPSQMSGLLSATGSTYVRFPWSDTNGDTLVQANEINYNTILASSTTYNAADPGNYRTVGAIDPNVKNDRTQEFIAGLDHQLFAGVGVSASYIWRKYDQFAWQDRTNITSANFLPVDYTPTNCPAGARCDTITYYQPNVQLAGQPFLYTNVADRWRDYNGFELSLAKRMANRWSANVSYAYNNAGDTWDSPNSYEDPSCRVDQCPGSQQYAPEQTGSGITGIFTNAKWLFKASGVYTMPLYDINVSANYNSRQGFPYPVSVQTPNRANGAGQAQIILDEVGDVRLDAVQTLDLRVDRPLTFGRVRLTPAVELFNVTNINTVLSRNRNQAAANANNISGIVAPRIIRFGVRVNF
ncbi:MAG: TonB-dependent receptor [Acidobacteria bacterium]|nr:TonB-dependent receptor [Acidobacteriota bacterium]